MSARWYLFLPALLLFNATAWATSLVLHNVNLVDVAGLTVISKQTVVIDAGRITHIGPAEQWRPSPGQVRLDLTGKYLIPGLIDAHVHLATDPEKDDREDVTLMRLRKLLRGGVTAIRDMGGDARVLAGLKRRADIGTISAPDIHYSVILAGRSFFDDPRTVSSSKGQTPGEVDWMRAIDDATDYDRVVISAQGAGASGLKVYADVTPAQLQQIVAAARRHAMPVWSHAYHRAVKPFQVSAAGVDVMSHSAYLAAEHVKDFYRLHGGNGSLGEEEVAASLNEDQYTPLFEQMLANNTLLDTTLSVFELTRKPDQPRSARELLYRYAINFARWANLRGIPLVAGTDTASDIAGLPFPAVHYEMQLMVDQAGLSPLQALQTATLNAALALGVEADQGTIAVGKVANLVVLEENPAIAIEHTLTVAHVLKNGRIIYPGKDDPRLPFSTARAGGGMLWLSGQIGNFPGTMVLADPSAEGQMDQAMRNIGQVLEDYGLDHDDLLKCTLMLANIEDWAAASEVYRSYFNPPLPARSAFAASGLALGAGVEIECVAALKASFTAGSPFP